MNTINCQCLSCLFVCVHTAHSWCLTNLWRVQNFNQSEYAFKCTFPIFLRVTLQHISVFSIKLTCTQLLPISNTNILVTRSIANQQMFNMIKYYCIKFMFTFVHEMCFLTLFFVKTWLDLVLTFVGECNECE